MSWTFFLLDKDRNTNEERKWEGPFRNPWGGRLHKNANLSETTALQTKHKAAKADGRDGV